MAGTISRLIEQPATVSGGGCSPQAIVCESPAGLQGTPDLPGLHGQCSTVAGAPVTVCNVAGERLLQVSLRECPTAAELKRLLQKQLSLPSLRLRLLANCSPELLEEDLELESLPMPRELTAVVLNYKPEFTVEVLNAAEDGDVGLTQKLLEKLADPNGSEGEGWTPLHITTLNGHLEVARCLLSAGADLARRNADGGSALHVAAWTGNLELMKVLFAARADPEKPQNEGWTPLHIASRNGHAQIVQWLLFDLGVNAYQRVDAGWTAAGIAWWAQHPSVSSVLDSYSATQHPLLRLWHNVTELTMPLFQWLRSRSCRVQ
mmetsp:Transcript_25034/g.58751  ORF Transcript_25034/g.58751 Transcript_25034/m.58751 type:complete len:319 (-) Transcript_25034:100-1056(-)